MISEGIAFKSYEKGEKIFSTGDKADRLFIVCSGKMKIYNYTIDGREQILYIYSKGDFVGAFNLLKEDEYKYNAEALEKIIISTLTKSKFDEIAIKNPNITLKILEKAYERIRWAEDLIARLTASSVDAKVANLLIDLIDDFGKKTDEGIELELSINREEMGSYAGISRETMTRKLNSFKDLSIIEFRGNKVIIIKDKNKLMDIINTSP
ncbi:MAG: Crp/Fnr family transcriptional regulator [Tissierellia bacterium]|nr:Crp/Fnr family transcriptional regulator [Tissierellia bacterium]